MCDYTLHPTELPPREMSKANPHFIRCLKPNASRLAGEFDDKYILSQVS